MSNYKQHIYFMDADGAVWEVNIKSMTRAGVTRQRQVLDQIFRGDHRVVMSVIPEGFYQMSTVEKS